MKVKDLKALIANADDEATVLVAGFETVACNWVAEADLVIECKTVTELENSMLGIRKLVREGESAIWIGWTNDYRTKSFLDAVKDPEEYSS